MLREHEHQIAIADSPATQESHAPYVRLFLPRDRRKPHVRALASPERGGGFCTAKSGGVTWYTDCIAAVFSAHVKHWRILSAHVVHGLHLGEVGFVKMDIMMTNLRTWYTDCIDCIDNQNRHELEERSAHVVHGLHRLHRQTCTNSFTYLPKVLSDCLNLSRCPLTFQANL